jgi:type I restriction enzyme S subunit
MTKLVPKLRFSGFSGEWEDKELGSLYTFFSTNSFPRDKLNYENGTVKNIHYGDIHTKFSIHFDITKERVPYINKFVDITRIKNEYYCLEGDIVFADASEDLDDIGKSIELTNLNNENLLAGLHTLLARQKEEKLIKGFAGYLFKSNLIRNQIKREAQGTKVLGISVRRLENIIIIFSKEPKEQQKIANCLSSLDNLIEVQDKKVDALAKYKKGLMQKLFPTNDEKIPKLRFKGFSGEWKEKKLEEIFNYKNGGSFEKNITENGSYYLITLNSIDIKGKLKKEHKTINKQSIFLEKNNLIMVLSDVAYGNFLGLTAIIPENNKYILNQRMGALSLNTDDNIQFIRFFINFNQKYFKNHGHGSSQQNLSKGDILTFIIKTPTILQEQQKIANILNSLDNLIEVQNKNIQILKTHKKGLIQQLFVNSEVN